MVPFADPDTVAYAMEVVRAFDRHAPPAHA
jgi:hypothetical protein